MDLKNLSTALFVNDIDISKEFYSEVLGLSVGMDLGKNVIFKNGLTIWEINDNHIITEKLGLEGISSKKYNRFEIYFETEVIEEVYKNLKLEGVNFLHEIHEEPWGQRTIRFFDPDHHLIEIGETMRQFVQRFHEQGMTDEEVSEKTSVPLAAVRELLGNS